MEICARERMRSLIDLAFLCGVLRCIRFRAEKLYMLSALWKGWRAEGKDLKRNASAMAVLYALLHLPAPLVKGGLSDGEQVWACSLE